MEHACSVLPFLPAFIFSGDLNLLFSQAWEVMQMKLFESIRTKNHSMQVGNLERLLATCYNYLSAD